jgi:hypothetical protein
MKYEKQCLYGCSKLALLKDADVCENLETTQYVASLSRNEEEWRRMAMKEKGTGKG